MSDPFHHFRSQLIQELGAPLPGRTAQFGMAPMPRFGAEMADEPAANARSGGVLAVFYPDEGGRLMLPLILRPTYSGVHSGQMGFPGGGREEQDSDLIATALREAYEELRIEPALVTVLGALTPLYVSASNYLVQPIVGWTPHRPDFHPDPYEVAALFEIPLYELLDPANRRSEPWTLRGRTVEVPYYAVLGQIVWGATAMMLSELLALPAIQAQATHERP